MPLEMPSLAISFCQSSRKRRWRSFVASFESRVPYFSIRIAPYFSLFSATRRSIDPFGPPPPAASFNIRAIP